MLLVASGGYESARRFFDEQARGERVVFSALECNREHLEELLQGSGLFAGEQTILCRDLVSDGVFEKELLESWAEMMSQSGHIWCIYEEDARKITKKIHKHSTKVHLPKVTKAKKPVFNIFSLTDQLLARNRKGLWIGYQKAAAAGVTADEVVPVLWWQVKILAKVASAEGSNPGLKPFVYQKAQQGLRRYTGKEVKDMARRLLQVLGEGRRQQTTAEELEQFILSL